MPPQPFEKERVWRGVDPGKEHAGLGVTQAAASKSHRQGGRPAKGAHLRRGSKGPQHAQAPRLSRSYLLTLASPKNLACVLAPRRQRAGSGFTVTAPNNDRASTHPGVPTKRISRSLRERGEESRLASKSLHHRNHPARQYAELARRRRPRFQPPREFPRLARKARLVPARATLRRRVPSRPGPSQPGPPRRTLSRRGAGDRPR